MYRVSSKLSDWRGEKAPVFPAFDVEDSDALAQYIKAQRNRIKGWARATTRKFLYRCWMDLPAQAIAVTHWLASGATS